MPKTRQMPERPATLVAAAAYLGEGITVRMVRQWVTDGRITAWRVGPKLLLVDLEELDGMTRVVVPSRAAAPESGAMPP